MSETASRLLELLALLQARRDWPGSELADRLEVSARTVRRDVRRLRDLGYPVESLSGPTGGYTLRAGTAMPPLLLDEGEAIAIAVGLRTAASASVDGIEEASLRALVKLEQVLPAPLRRRVAALGSASVLPAVGPTVDPRHLTAIATACRDDERLRFVYTRRDGERARREVEAHALVNRGRRWYLVGWDLGREDWRTFRVDRIERPTTTGVRFAPRELPAADASAFVERSISDRPSRFEARVTVAASAEQMQRRFPPYWGSFTPLDESSCEFRPRDDDLDWLAIRIAMLGTEFEVHEPPELVAHLEQVAARLRRATAAPRRTRAAAPRIPPRGRRRPPRAGG
ncbi:MAG: YafY family protein [Solirubrobacterales bacterium]